MAFATACGAGEAPSGEALDPNFTVLDYAYNGQVEKLNRHLLSMNIKSDFDLMEERYGTEGRRAGVYGEANHTAVVELLRTFQLPRGSKFYDLGSGSGKVAMTAWLMGFNVTAIEFSKSRFLHACEALGRLESAQTVGLYGLGTLEMLNADFLRYDWSDADVIFTNSIMFNEELMAGLSTNGRRLKEGTMILTGKRFLNPKAGPPYFKDIAVTNTTPSPMKHGSLRLQRKLAHSESPEPCERGGAGCGEQAVPGKCMLPAERAVDCPSHFYPGDRIIAKSADGVWTKATITNGTADDGFWGLPDGHEEDTWFPHVRRLLEPGDAVLVQEAEGTPWMMGRVVEFEQGRPRVFVDAPGWDEKPAGILWDRVRRPLRVGDKVEVRDDLGSPWLEGVVREPADGQEVGRPLVFVGGPDKNPGGSLWKYVRCPTVSPARPAPPARAPVKEEL